MAALPESPKTYLPVDQHKWIQDGHNAAIKEKGWQSIAEFIVNGQSAPAPELKRRRLRVIVSFLSAIAFACWLLLICAVVAGLFG